MKYYKYSFVVLVVGLLFGSMGPIKAVSNEKVDDDQVENVEMNWLSYDEKVEFLQNLLQDTPTLDLNVSLIALNLSKANKDGLEWFVSTLQEIAKLNNDREITMQHVENIFEYINKNHDLEDLSEDLQDDFMTCSQKLREVALHEAGHAVVALFSEAHKFLYIESMNMQSDTSRDGLIVGSNHFIPLYENQSELNEDELKAYLCVDLGGLASEVVFKDLIGNQHPELDGPDADQAGVNMDLIIRSRSHGAYGAMDNREESDDLLMEMYKKTVALIDVHKEKTEKLALQLLKKKVLDADEIYEICGVEKPKLEIQRRSSSIGCKKKSN